MLDTIRDQERELTFCYEVMKQMFKHSELQEKEVNLPRIRNAQALVEAELDKRDIVFDDEQD
jgi:hypothetical protein